MGQTSSAEEEKDKNMGEFTEIVDPSDFEEEFPVVIDKVEKDFIESYLRGESLEDSADAAGMDYSYAVKLIKRADVKRLIAGITEDMADVGEIQKREALNLLTEVARTSPIEYVDDDGEFSVHDLKENNVPIKGLKTRYGKDGELVGTEVTFHDPLQAVKMMSDVQGWNAAQKVEHSGFVGGLSPDMLKNVDALEIDAEAEIVEDIDEDLKKKLLA